jgi:hypothetical protein
LKSSSLYDFCAAKTSSQSPALSERVANEPRFIQFEAALERQPEEFLRGINRVDLVLPRQLPREGSQRRDVTGGDGNAI